MELSEELKYEGCNFFRQRIVFALLSGRPVMINEIRALDDEPGIKDFEMKLLSLIEKITNGSRIEINKTGTRVSFWPGMIQGGNLTMDCGNERCLSYFLEPLVLLAPFAKHPVNAKLSGVTNCPGELPVDAVRATWLPMVAKFLLNDEGLELKVNSRGLKPDGGGSVTFSAPICQRLRPVQHEKSGKCCKIRGLAYVTKVSPALAARMIDAAKTALRGYIADVYITLDQRKGTAGGNSPGFGLFLTAETTEGVFYYGEAISKPKGADGLPSIPEDVGTLAAHNLLSEIYSVCNMLSKKLLLQGGCVDSSAQCVAATFMCLGERNVSKYLFGPLTTYGIYTLRHLRDFFDVTFKIDDWTKIRKEADEEKKLGSEEKAMLTCIGAGYANLNKVIL